MSYEHISNVVHADLTRAFSSSNLDTEHAKLLLVTIAVQNLASGPTATIHDVVIKSHLERIYEIDNDFFQVARWIYDHYNQKTS